MACSSWGRALLGWALFAAPVTAAAQDDAPPEATEAQPEDELGKVGPDGRHPRVDRLASRLPDGQSAPDGFAPSALDAEWPGVTVVAAIIDTPDPARPDVDRIRLTVDVPEGGARLLLADAGAIFFAPDGTGWIPVPNQQVVVPPPKTVAVFDALPLKPAGARPRPGTALAPALITEPGLMATLRTVQRIEAEDVYRLRRYVRKDGAGGYTVKTAVRNEDVRVAGWMEWTEGPDGRAMGRLPIDAVRMAIYSVTVGFTIQDIADWLRLERNMDMEPAIEGARALARQSEFILERAGLEFRTQSPRHAEFNYNQGVSAFDEGDLVRAEKLFREAIEKKRDMIDAHFNLGVTLYRAGKYDEASSAFLVASGFDDAPARVFFNRGATLYRKGDALGAARQFRKVLEKEPENADAKAWLDKADPEGKTAPPPPKKKRKKRRRRRK